MLDLIKGHPFLATFAIGAGTMLASELIWYAIKYVGPKFKPTIQEVIVFNELGEMCAGQHQYRQSPGSLTNKASYVCQNRFCSLRNIQRIVDRLEQAQYSIDFAMYTFTSFPLMAALKRALQRGVVIRVISDREMVYSSGSQVVQLTAYGVPVRGPDSTCMMHHKYCMIDGDVRVQEIMRLGRKKYKTRSYCSIVITGSINWTKQGFGGNWENCVISSDQRLTKVYQDEFNRMWKAFEKTTVKLQTEK